MGICAWLPKRAITAKVAINRASDACKTTGHQVSDHFRGVTKMIELGKGGKREIDDFMQPALITNKVEFKNRR